MHLTLRTRVSAALLAFGLAAPSAHAIELFVGQGPACNASSLSGAVATAAANGPGPHTIWLSNEIAYDNQRVSIGDMNLTIRGIHGCDMFDDDFIVLNGDGTDSVLRIAGSAARTVTLTNLVIRGGRGTSGAGGGIRMTGAINVTLDNTVVRENTAERGGGIYVELPTGTTTGGQLTLLPGAVVEHNTATQGSGGGIYAVGGHVRMHVSGTRVGNNTAAGAGGGIAILDGTFVSNGFVPQQQYTADGAKIVSNTAGTIGGGLYVNGTSAVVYARELIVDSNKAATGGGGIFASGGARVDLRRDTPPVLFGAYAIYCAAWHECSRLSYNTVAQGAAGGYGAALALSSGARAQIVQTVVRNNLSADAPGMHVRTSTLWLEGVLFAGNHSVDSPTQGTAVIRAVYTPPEAVPQLRVAYSTFNGNTAMKSNGEVWPANDVIAQQNTGMELYAVALFDSPYTPTAYGPYIDDCIVRGTGGGLGDPYGTHTRSAVVTSAGFNAASAFDFRLRSNSALTDHCDQQVYVPEFRDLVLTPRCTDTPGKADVHGRCDVGAYESDHIFGNGYQ
jgi:hypothetical protein